MLRNLDLYIEKEIPEFDLNTFKITINPEENRKKIIKTKETLNLAHSNLDETEDSKFLEVSFLKDLQFSNINENNPETLILESTSSILIASEMKI